MKNLLTLLFAAVAAAVLVAICCPKEQTNVEPQPIEAPARIVVHINESDDPVNVYVDEIPLSNGWQCFIQDTCRRFGVPYELMLGVLEIESGFDFEADSGWAYGICQIGYINEDWLAEEGIDIYSNMGNIEAGCMILSDYLSRYTEDQALMAYNQGEYGASEDWDSGIYQSEYSRAVQEAAEKWRVTINESNRIRQERKGS